MVCERAIDANLQQRRFPAVCSISDSMKHDRCLRVGLGIYIDLLGLLVTQYKHLIVVDDMPAAHTHLPSSWSFHFLIFTATTLLSFFHVSSFAGFFQPS